ncbi:MAG: methylenetetrahydrofolate reductase C-terminal domain-containing protein [Desulfobulbaceae bacterium]|uniref:Methylenetetrahydrofolate reductase n=1 Tax=Candidatus Desulfobia pelagia TaxID=2841692 RepID=A0A8J6NDT2_9BACT|nr:methylenetetrahydrofolate reductase C-terminal domain-containing protein [Candidatus Desulfobia pelagia]
MPSSRFQQSLKNPDDFTLTFELIPTRGGRNRKIDATLRLAGDLTIDGRIEAVSITDNAGGHPALTPDVVGLEMKELGLDVISHFSCKDKNRNEMESLLFGWDRVGLHNLLIISGDYPQKGYCGNPKPVFDMDSVHVLDLLSHMNTLEYSSHATMPTRFFKGVVVSPFKTTEAEQIMQYYKLHRKIIAGADYVITQLGYDARKFHETLLYMQLNGLNKPVLGNVFIPSMPLVELMHKNQLPGCVIPDSLYKEFQLEAKAKDRGKKARIDRGARLLAVMKGMGYNGAHIGGPGLTMEDFDFLLTRATKYETEWESLIPDLTNWPQDQFYCYRKDERSGLNLPEQLPRKKPALIQKPRPTFTAANLTHVLVFESGGPFFKIAKKISLAMAETRLQRPFHLLEYLIKFILFKCQDCGDCTLSKLGFICPQSSCAKYLLNGPCGGSRDGWCEIYPGRRKCLYVRAYQRLAPWKKEEQFKTGFVPPRNWKLADSSSWINFFSGKDNSGGCSKE